MVEMFGDFSRDTFTVGWGTLALINTAIAQSKNRNAVFWLLASLLTGPVATAVLVVLPKYEPMEEDLEKERQKQAKVEKVTNVVLIVLIIILLSLMVGAFAYRFMGQ